LNTVFRGRFVQLRPGARLNQLLRAGALEGLPQFVRRLELRRVFSRPVAHRGKPVLLLELDAEPVEDELRIARPMHSERRRVNTIDRDMHVQVIGIVVYDAHALVLGESKGLARTPAPIFTLP
jgi:hypothetical protein